MKYLFYLLIFLLLPFGLKADETTERMDTLRVYYCICKTEEVLQSVEARQLTATDSLYRSDTLEDELDESVILYLMAELAWGEDTLHPSNYGNQEAFELSLRQKAIDKLSKNSGCDTFPYMLGTITVCDTTWVKEIHFDSLPPNTKTYQVFITCRDIVITRRGENNNRK